MLTVSKVKTLAQAKWYYEHYAKNLPRDDYYLKKDAAGHWFGKCAATLGLTGEIKTEDWDNIVEGKNKAGQQIVEPGYLRIKNKNGTHSFVIAHNPGTDLTFSAPKSVSIMALIPGKYHNIRLIEAHNKSVEKTLAYIEKNYSEYRVKKGGFVGTVKTDNVVAGTFTHLTARAVENFEPDPDLHTHAFVMNITERGGQFKSLNNPSFYQHKMFFGQIFRNFEAAEISKLGLRIEAQKNGFYEIKGVSRETIETFSKRGQQINEKVAEADIDNAKTRAKAALLTRQKKDKDLDMTVVRKSWVNELEPCMEKGFTPEIGKAKQALQQKSPVLQAVASLSESEVHWSKEQLIKQSLKEGLGDCMTLTDIEKDIEKQIAAAGTLLELEKEKVPGEEKEAKDQQKWKVKLPKEEVLRRQKINEIIMTEFRAITQQDKLKTRFTTSENILIEREIVENVKMRQNTLPGLDTADVQQQLDQKYNYLRPEQKNAVGKITTSSDGIFLVQGYAGSGKTTMLKAAKELYEQKGYNVTGMSFTGNSAEKLQRETGIPSATIHSSLYMLQKEELQPARRPTEREIMRQTMPQIWIVDEASMTGNKQMLELTQRASEQNAKLVLVGDRWQFPAISAGSPFAVLQEKEVCGKVEMKDFLRQRDQNLKEAVRESVLGDVKKAVEKLEDSTMEIANKEKRREQIVKEFTGREKEVRDKTMILTSRNSSREKLNADIRQELQNKDELDKKEFAFKTTSNRGKESEKSFAKGDKVIFLKNDRALDVKNGTMGAIEKINKQGDMSVKTENGTKDFNVKKNYDHIDHGYAITNYKAQSQTIESVLINHDTETSLTNRNSFYVQISRATDEVKIYTNDKEGLERGIENWQEKATSYDLKVGEDMSVKEIEKEINDRFASLQRDKDNPELAQLEKHGEEMQKFEGKDIPGMEESQSGIKDSGQKKEYEPEQEMAMS